MKNFILSLIAVLFTLSFGVHDVEAKRLGGGSSLGMQRQATPQQAPRPSSTPTAPQQPTQGAAATTPPPKRSWLGPIAGLAAGIGLAALFSHLGLGSELASFAMLALLGFAAVTAFRLLTRRSETAQNTHGMQYAGATPAADGAHPPGGNIIDLPAGNSDANAPAIPHDFDTAAFVRQAKVHFIRLQAAHDVGNLEDIREFTTPEMFAEIRLQMADRGNATQHTDVIELNADVVEVADETQRYIVSVRFTGLLREETNAAPAHFDEIWHLTKPRNGSGGWVVAGIQQIA